MTSQTRRIEIAAPQRTKAWFCAGVHEHGHYVDNRRATILLGGEGSDGSTTTAQASLTVADARGLLAALEWMLAELELQTPKQCATTSAPSPSPQVVNCHQCQVAIATWSTRQMFDAGWGIGTGRYWYCPACKEAK